MVDFDDVGDAALLAPLSGLGLVVFAVIIAVLYFAASDNAEECAKKTCRNGTAAVLMAHECRCVEAPLKDSSP